ncbi:polysaccharide deacetylase family protein [Parabacteroides sp. FAFU027]|uniref:polysaccharide deacetylase family protein n=1 Tax=Parabacteroides sp. FAFU027 TaxID=2922715 RepID=UPI001FAE9EAA|nr:polysaccharide deacetylase family protein [Parabacteroides sp. FAFU027]
MKTTNTAIALVCMLLLAPVMRGADKKVCFTIDDLPVSVQNDTTLLFELQVTTSLIKTFTQYHIPAIGFVNESDLYNDKMKPDQKQVDLLRAWMNARLELGNHTYSHPDYNQTNYRAFTDDILEGEKIIRPLMAQYHKKLRYFRHPFLSIGETKAKADSLTRFLTSKKYIVAPVTVHNDDWKFNDAYDSAMVQKDTALMRKIGTCYLEYTQEQLDYSEKLSQLLFGRSINQVMLLHANAINRDYIDRIAQIFRDKGYQFISLKEAIKDKAYKTEITYYNEYNPAWLLRWAASSGLKREQYENWPLTPEFILKLAHLPLFYK